VNLSERFSAFSMSSTAVFFFSLILGIAFIVVATTRWKLHPVVALLVTAYGLGLANGLPAKDIVSALTGGFGGTLSHIGIVIACGCVIGTLLEKSGAATALAQAVIRLIGASKAVLGLSCTGAIVSIPVFCDSGFVILAPLAKSLARNSGRAIATFAIALAMGLYTTHCLVPPTPGPIAAAGALGADIGWVMLLGGIVAIPVIIITYLFAMWAGRREPHPLPTAIANDEPDSPPFDSGTGSLCDATLPILLPLTAIGLRSVAMLPSRPLGDGLVLSFLQFIGEPNTALIIGLLLAFFLTRRFGKETLGQWTSTGLHQAGIIILITGAGGALGGVLRATPMAGTIGDLLGNVQLGSLNILLPFLVAAILKTALGSSTVALITTASLMAPVLSGLGLSAGFGPILATLAVASGSMVVSHANDSFFWVVTQVSGLSVSQGYRLLTMASLIAGTTAMLIVWLLGLLLL
jgi:GntP family gluconate:H+ symporter